MNQKLSAGSKLLYGVGFTSRGVKDGLFQVFLLFYFIQVLGLDAILAGTASLIALIVDAISDPVMGYISDNWKSKKWGRRHPFMLVSAIPMGVFLYFLFAPPEGLNQTNLFLWMTVFLILLRLSYTLFLVPGMSLGAEFSTDYQEKTSIMSYRILFPAVVSPIILMIGYAVYFVPTEEYENGMFNEPAYGEFALVCGIIVTVAVLVSTLGTRKFIPNLPQQTQEADSFGLKENWNNILKGLKMKSYLTLLGYTIILYIAFGVGTAFTTFFMTYYFELTALEQGVLPIGAALGGFLSILVTPNLGRFLDKKWGALISTVLFSFFFSLPFNFRILGIYPENGTEILLPVYVTSLIFAYLFLYVAMGLASSMMADVVDEYQLKTGQRQEGLFFSSMSFAYKCSYSVGAFIATLLLTIIAFPKQAKIGEVPQDAINGLGIIGGPVLFLIYLFAIVFIYFYPITKDRYFEIRRALDKEY